MGLLHFFRPYTNSTLKQSALYINTSADPAMQHTLGKHSCPYTVSRTENNDIRETILVSLNNSII